MTTLSIEFDPRRLSAKIAVSDPGVAWESIRRACEDHSDEVVVEGSNSLEMPWWAFLGCRSAVGYYVSRFGLELHVDDQTRDVLKVAAETEAVIRNAEELPSLPEADVLAHLAEAGFARQLKTFQLRNVAQLSRLDVGATFSVPGAGKITEAIAFYCLRRRPDSRLLVICPKNAFAAWEEQLAICLPASPHKFVRLVGGATAIRREVDREPHLTLMTYQQFPNVRRIVTAYLDRYPNMIFLDESHRIKRGADGKIANAILRVGPIANVRLIMSGTPLPNAVSDLVPQAKFIVPQAILDEDTVRDFIRPLYVRTRKSELLLPPINRAVVTISMAPAQRRLYELMRSEIARQADELLSMRDRRALRRLGRSAMTLLQFTSNPALLARRPFAYEELLADVLEEGDSPKLAFACWRARILASQHHKIIIWSSFVENVEVIADRLADLGADYIHGGVEASNDLEEDSREAKVRRFHDDPGAYVLVANPAACGEGISLHTVCHHAIYVDRTYNAGQYLQSEDRIHRIGVDQNTTVEILACHSSVDESVQRRLQEKITQMGQVLDDPDLDVIPVTVDADEFGFDQSDLADFMSHLKAYDKVA